jgi:hypothetical protein
LAFSTFLKLSKNWPELTSGLADFSTFFIQGFSIATTGKKVNKRKKKRKTPLLLSIFLMTGHLLTRIKKKRPHFRFRAERQQVYNLIYFSGKNYFSQHLSDNFDLSTMLHH